MKKAGGPIKPIFLEMPEEIHRAMRALGIQTSRKVADVYVEAAAALLNRCAFNSDISEIPAKESRKTPVGLSELPDYMIDLLRTHQEDPRCMDCIIAIGRIWDLGLEDVKDAITRNCKVFAKASEAMKGLRDDSGRTAEGHEGRVGALLDNEARGDEAINNSSESAGNPPASGEGMPIMGAKPARKKQRRG